MENWDDRKKFKSETIRTIVLYVLAAIVALIFIQPFNDQSAYRGAVDREKLSLRAKVVDEFIAKSYKFTSIAYDACLGDSESISRFKGDVYDDYRKEENRFRLYFGDLSIEIPMKLDKIDSTERVLYKYVKLADANEKLKNKTDWLKVLRELKEQNQDVARCALGKLGLKE